MLSIILSCVTEVRYVMVEGGGSVIAAFFLAHNYLSEQFGNYVEYGMPMLHFYFFANFCSIIFFIN